MPIMDSRREGAFRANPGVLRLIADIFARTRGYYLGLTRSSDGDSNLLALRLDAPNKHHLREI
jgi:hypothetical protein